MGIVAVWIASLILEMQEYSCAVLGMLLVAASFLVGVVFMVKIRLMLLNVIQAYEVFCVQYLWGSLQIEFHWFWGRLFPIIVENNISPSPFFTISYIYPMTCMINPPTCFLCISPFLYVKLCRRGKWNCLFLKGAIMGHDITLSFNFSLGCHTTLGGN